MLPKRLRFAVLSRSRSKRTAQRETELARAYRETWQRWWDLFGEVDVWEDSAKRAAMYQARFAYQDASVAWFETAIVVNVASAVNADSANTHRLALPAAQVS